MQSFVSQTQVSAVWNMCLINWCTSQFSSCCFPVAVNYPMLYQTILHMVSSENQYMELTIKETARRLFVCLSSKSIYAAVSASQVFSAGIQHASHTLATAPVFPRDTEALTALSVRPSACLTFCRSAWGGCMEQDVATQAISSNPSGSYEETWHPWPWKQWFLLWWNIYFFICFFFSLFCPFSLLLPCCPTLQMSFVGVDPVVFAACNKACTIWFLADV